MDSMKAIEVIGDIDERHCLQARVPEELSAGPVRLIVLVPNEGDQSVAWARDVAAEWGDELGDTRQDIYTLHDGDPVNATR
jgi:hypothetical protein